MLIKNVMKQLDKPRIIVTAEMEHLPAACAILDKACDVVYAPTITDSELLATIAEYDAIVTNIRQVIGKSVLDAATKLRLIATPSTGTDHIDVEYAESRGIVVQSIKRDYDLLKTITSTAEHAFLLMLSCLRRLPFAFDSVRRGEWVRDKFCGREAEGRVVGIIGYGRLGEIFSRLANGFGMKVIACDPSKTINDVWVKQVEMDELLKTAEIISLHVHLTPETENLIGQCEFDLMRDGVYLVNTSCGKLIDEEALLDALKSGKVKCAGIDVLANELTGDIDSDLLVEFSRTHDSLIITPHIGGMSSDAQEKAFSHMASKLVVFLTKIGNFSKNGNI